MEPITISKSCRENINKIYEEYSNKNDRSYVDFYEFRRKLRAILHASLEIHAEKNNEIKGLIDWVKQFDKKFIKNHSDDVNENVHLFASIKES